MFSKRNTANTFDKQNLVHDSTQDIKGWRCNSQSSLAVRNEIEKGLGATYSVVGLVCPRSEEQISEPIAV